MVLAARVQLVASWVVTGVGKLASISAALSPIVIPAYELASPILHLQLEIGVLPFLRPDQPLFMSFPCPMYRLRLVWVQLPVVPDSVREGLNLFTPAICIAAHPSRAHCHVGHYHILRGWRVALLVRLHCLLLDPHVVLHEFRE